MGSHRRWGPGWCPPLTVTPSHHSHRTLLASFDRVVPHVLGQADATPWGWSRHVVSVGTAVRRDGTPVLRTMAVIAPRQSAKTTMLIALKVIWWQLGLRVAFTLHERGMAREKFLLFADVVERLAGPRARISRANGHEVVRDRAGGGLVRLVTPDADGGRSDTYDVVVIDEAAFIRPAFLGAVRPAMVTRPRSQIWMVSSAGTEASDDLARAAADARSQIPLPAGQRTAGIYELGAPADARHDDESVYARCIPTLGHRGGVRIEALRDDRATMGPDEFAREYLGRWTVRVTEVPIAEARWREARVEQLPPRDELHRVTLGVDVAPDQSMASIVICAIHRDAGTAWAMLAVCDDGDGWVVAEARKLARLWRATEVVGDAIAAGTLLGRLDRAGTAVHVVTETGMSQACAGLVTELGMREIHVVADDTLTAAALTAQRRPLGDRGWAFRKRADRDDRRAVRSAPDITSVVALALGVHRSRQL